MLSTSKIVLFPGHNHLLPTGADDRSLSLSPPHWRLGNNQMEGHQHRWLAGG